MNRNGRSSRQFPSSTPTLSPDDVVGLGGPSPDQARLKALQAAGSGTLLTSKPPMGTDDLGLTGLKQIRGYLYEEDMPELSGPRGVQTFKVMGRDAVIASILFGLKAMTRQVKWDILPAQNPKSESKAEAAVTLIKQAQMDMERPWSAVLYDMVSAYQYGWSVLETTYKWRRGRTRDARTNSIFDDNKMGWRHFSIRSQDTLVRWEYSPDGRELLGMWQISPPTFKPTLIPEWKCVHFTTDQNKESPEGTSLLRGAYQAWVFKQTLQNIEAVGIERDLAGLPVVWVPPEMLDPNAPSEIQQQLNAYKQLAINMKRDDQEGIVFPNAYDQSGHKIFDVTLLSTGGHRQFDTSAVIDRYSRDAAMSVLMDTIFLGHENSGSFALADSKQNMLAQGLLTLLDSIADQWNSQAIAPLCDFNNIDPEDRPYLHHGQVGNANLAGVADFLLKVAQAGAPIFPMPSLEDFLLDMADLPVPTKQERDEQDQMKQQVADLQQQLTDQQTVMAQATRDATGSTAQQSASVRAGQQQQVKKSAVTPAAPAPQQQPGGRPAPKAPGTTQKPAATGAGTSPRAPARSTQPASRRQNRTG